MTSKVNAITPERLADLLSASAPAVLTEWLASIKGRLRATSGKSDSYLIDHTPLYLEAMAKFLRHPDETTERLARHAFEHGENRARSPDYITDDLLIEYAVLRDVIISLVPVDVMLDHRVVSLMGRATDIGVQNSTRSFLTNTVVAGERSARLLIEENDAHLRATFEQMPTPIALLKGPEHRFRFANAAYRSNFLRRIEFIGERVADVIPGATEQGFVALLDSVYRGGQRVTGNETPFTLSPPDGPDRKFYFNFVYEPTRAPDGTIEGILVTISDVTEQVEARTRVEESQRQLNLALRGGKLGAWSIQMPSQNIVADDTTRFLHDLRADDDAPLVIARQIHPEDRASVSSAIEAAVAGDEVFDVEYRVKSRDGMYRWLYSRGEVHPGVDGEPGVLAGVASDITDKKMTEALLHFERHKLRAIFEQSPSPMALFRGPDMIYEMINPTYGALLKGREIVGRSLVDVLPEIVGTPVVTAIQQVFATGQPFSEKEMVSKYVFEPGGPMETRYFDNTFVRLVDGVGRPYGVFNTAVDVTERVRARKVLEDSERRAEASERRLKDVLTNGRMGAWEIKFPENVLYADEQFRLFHGANATEDIDQAIDRMGHPDDAKIVRERLRHSVATGDPYVCEYRVRTANGGYKWVAARGRPRYDDAGRITLISGVAFEIEEQKKTEFALAAAKLDAERANDAKSAFLANMSHEIRTPLGAISGFSDLARQKGATKDEVNTYLAVVERNSVQVLRIIDDILDLAKVEAGRVTLETIEVELPSFLADFSSLMAFRARDNGIGFEMTAASDLPSTICTDPTRLRQVLTNAVGNAIKFTTRGHVRVHVSYVEDRLSFTVTDTGRGISEDQASRLFQAFAQADVSTTRKYGGTGLGLVLTRRLCQLLGGDYVLARSQIGVGSEFVATIHPKLPSSAKLLTPSQIDFVVEPAVRSVVDSGRLNGVRVLLVEDSPDNQVLIQLILEKQGARVNLASDGAEGVRTATAGEFDVVLMDIQMPVMDGHEATRMLRMMAFDKPIVALTAHAMKEEAERARSSGFTSFLSKPIHRESLIETVRTLARGGTSVALDDV